MVGLPIKKSPALLCMLPLKTITEENLAGGLCAVEQLLAVIVLSQVARTEQAKRRVCLYLESYKCV